MWDKKKTSIPELYVLNPFSSEDYRGNFVKIFEKDIFTSLHLPNETNEVFVSTSKPGVVRGMHFQYHNPQTKYVSVIKGKIFDVAIDLRMESETFGKWHAVELSADNHYVFAIPAGFAHGFQVLGNEEAVVVYQCSGKYDKESDTGIVWNDPEINVRWPDYKKVILSSRDEQLMTFSEFKNAIKGLITPVVNEE